LDIWSAPNAAIHDIAYGLRLFKETLFQCSRQASAEKIVDKSIE